MSSRLQSNQRLDYVVDTDQLFSNRSTANDVVPKRRSSFDSEHAPLVDESELDDEQSLASRIDRVLGHNNDDNADFNNSNKVANSHSASSMAGGHGGGVSDDNERTYFGTSVWRLYWERTLWLVGLLLLQSYASLILEAFEALIQQHVVITLFLPMLIGAGGNASNQSAMLVVRGLATGEVTRHNFVRLIVRELSLALFIGSTMMAVAYTRVYLFHSADGNSAALAVGAATMGVMLLAIILGTVIPLTMEFCRIDPAHAGPVVAVMVDLCGVAIICTVCNAILSPPTMAMSSH